MTDETPKTGQPNNDTPLRYQFLEYLVDSGLAGRIPGSELKILVCLLRHSNSKTLISFPGIKRLAIECGINPKQTSVLCRKIKQLVDDKIIRILDKPSKYGTTQRQLTIPKKWVPLKFNDTSKNNGTLNFNAKRLKNNVEGTLNFNVKRLKNNVVTHTIKHTQIKPSRRNARTERADGPSPEGLSDNEGLMPLKETIVSRLNKHGIAAAGTIFNRNPEDAARLLVVLIEKDKQGALSLRLARSMASAEKLKEHREDTSLNSLFEKFSALDSAEGYKNLLAYIDKKTFASHVEARTLSTEEKELGPVYRKLLEDGRREKARLEQEQLNGPGNNKTTRPRLNGDGR